MDKFEKALRKAGQERASHRVSLAVPSGTAAAEPMSPAPAALGVDATALIVTNDAALDLVALDYSNPSADLFRILRTQVLKAIKKLPAPTIGVCSAEAGEGKTFVAANLAGSIALSQEWGALLVDLDLRRPSLHQHFGIAPNPGITDFLSRNIPLAECVRQTMIAGLEILTGGTSIRNSSEALGSSRLDEAFLQLSRAVPNRVTLCDLPPILASDDALLFSAKLGGVILIIEEGRTTAANVQRSVELLASTQIIGTVLNKSKSRSSSYYSYGGTGA